VTVTVDSEWRVEMQVVNGEWRVAGPGRSGGEWPSTNRGWLENSHLYKSGMAGKFSLVLLTPVLTLVNVLVNILCRGIGRRHRNAEALVRRQAVDERGRDPRRGEYLVLMNVACSAALWRSVISLSD
jgi:hypothetical protein